MASEGETPENPLTLGCTTSPTVSAENIEADEQNYETTLMPPISSNRLVESGEIKERNCEVSNVISRETQWLAADTGDALLLKDHTYSCVPPWDPQPETAQALTSTPKKSSANTEPPLFDPDEDIITNLTFSSVEEDENDSSFQLSFEELDDTIESNLEMHDQDGMDKFEKMCSVPKYIVFEDELLKLFNRCVICGEEVLEKDLVKKGSMLKIITFCRNSHSKEWVSQPTVKRAAAGNLLLSGAILFTGNTFSRVSEMASTVNLAFPGESDYLNYQNKHLFPVINECWQQEKASVLADLLDRESVTLIGDGRCDSPGYSAKYGTYTMMDTETKNIVDFDVVHVKQTTSSQAMEKLGFQRCLDRALDSGIPVDVVGTDRHTGIKALMRTVYKDRGVEHQVDVWHLCKNIKSKLAKKAKKKGCEELAPWIKSVTNHLWWSSMTCEGNAELLKEKWTSILHHVADKHSWDSSTLYNRCPHDPISATARRKTKWLKAGSPAHEALKEVVMEKRLLNDLELLSKFIHTGALEVYHSLYNKYMPKRQHFSHKGMTARSQLAALDHNSGTGREQMVTSRGDKQYRYVYPKGMKDWVVKPVFEKKSKQHVRDMMHRVLESRATGEDIEEVEVPDLPRNIAPVPRPPKEELLARHASRFGKKI